MLYISGPQPFWHQGPVSWKTIFPQTGGGGVGGDGSSGDGWWQMKTRSLARRSPPAVQPAPNRPWTSRLGTPALHTSAELILTTLCEVAAISFSREEEIEAPRNSERLRNLPQVTQPARAEQGLEARCACL